MKYITILIASIFFICSCSNDQSSKTTETATVKVETVKEAGSQINPVVIKNTTGVASNLKNPACDYLELNVLAKSMNWSEKDIAISTDNKDSNCQYKYGNETVILDLDWIDEESQKDAPLTKKFQQILTEGLNGIKFKELNNDFKGQSLMGTNKIDENEYHYMLLKRIKNKVMISFTIKTNDSDKVKVQNKLLRIIKRMEHSINI